LEKKRNKEYNRNKTVESDDLAELAYVYFNVFNIEQAGDFILRWRPEYNLFYITQSFVKRLLDKNLCDDVYKLLSIKENKIYNVLAIIYELSKIGKTPPISIVKKYLSQLKKKKHNFIPDNIYGTENHDIIDAFISFMEICYYYNLPATDIINQIFIHFSFKIAYHIKDNHGFDYRYLYMRAISLIYKLNGNLAPSIQNITPKEWHDKNKKEYDSDLKRVKNIISALLPIYFFRLETFSTGKLNIKKLQKIYNDDSRDYQISDVKQHDYSILLSDLIIFCKLEKEDTIRNCYEKFVSSKSVFFIRCLHSLLYAANRCCHLFCIRKDIELKIHDIIRLDSSDSPEEKANAYVKLSRAVFPQCFDDAAAYFNEALEEVSRFGDEISHRWRAVAALGDRASEGKIKNEKNAYRFIRCAEIVGDTVAREKYWDRDKAICVLGRISPTSALAAISRWRDRDIGWFPRQLEALAISLLVNKQINSLQAWALNPFLEHGYLLSFAIHCLENTQFKSHQKIIANSAFNVLRIHDGSNTDWEKLRIKTESLGIKIENIDEAVDYFAQIKGKDSNINLENSYKTNQDDIDWDSVFNETNYKEISSTSYLK
jgi:hypothetical protein